MKGYLCAIAVVLIATAGVVAWSWSHDRAAAAAPPWIPNQFDPQKAGKVEVTRYPDKIVVSNYQTQPIERCVLLIDARIRGDVGDVKPGETKTIMRTRFEPYVEADAFYALAKKDTRMQCLIGGRVMELTLERTYEGTIKTR